MVQTDYLPKDIELALCREASMSAMSIGIGLTHIRQYDFVKTGFFYNGLLSFTSGLERFAKIILIYDYRLKNSNAFPGNNYLKQHGHGLEKLLTATCKINIDQSASVDDSFFDSDPLYQKLISLLTNFATQARYYNLDYLVDNKQSSAEPLVQWDKDICGEILRRHYKPDEEKIALKKKLAQSMEPFSYVQFTREDGDRIDNLADFLTYGDSIPVKQQYSVYYLYKIVYFLYELCVELEFKGNFFPYLHEFFVIFGNNDADFILEKKSWLPIPPYMDS